MTTPDLPERLNISRSSTADAAAAEPSPNGTTFYSTDEPESGQKRQGRGEDHAMLATKQQKTYHDGDKTLPTTPTTPAPALTPSPTPVLASRSTTLSPSTTAKYFQSDFTVVNRKPFELEMPDWSANTKAWAFLQSQNPKYPNVYLVKKELNGQERTGYLLGRQPDSDIRFEQSEISKRHCLIYMETGSNGKAKGIRIFLEDLSFNGTWVNGTLVGVKNRVMLRNRDEIQLFRRSSYAENDLRQKFYRVLFPPIYEAHICDHEYEIRRLLGRGNFASVHHAIHRGTGAVAAIKVLNKNRFAQKPRMIQAIIQEVGIMMSLRKHPLVVNIDRVFNEQHKIYLVLEYVPGGELFDYVSTNKTIDEDSTRFIFWQLFMAIKYLHDNNIAHRDLKPENVLLADREKLHIKITDFGLAKTEHRDQSFGSQCGTPNYVAPEILNAPDSRGYDKQCDLWSLGVMLYICLCGFPPFSEENAPPSMKAQIKMGKYTFPSPYWDNISELAKNLIRSLLTVDPIERLNVREALLHEWMHQNREDLKARQNRLGEAVLADILQSEQTVDVTPTQVLMTQSQSLERF
ncbi:hypothetical protein [Parasitella parasitica]|uniref:Non-specific serine/threonine protein kinase n=1 Tax=Parasitella parasitica TaxID=35722 RepID=A0A0B7NAG3_9FUNG|nr:hypothetical protein [Parasitella parasitica]